MPRLAYRLLARAARKPRPAEWLVCTALTLSSCALAQNALSEGRRMVAALKLDQALDVALFNAIGLDRSQQLLMAVISNGQLPSATAEDWRDLHRATNGIIELCIARGEIFKASIFASFQNGLYRSFEHDYRAALDASRRALKLHEQSGVVENLDLSWTAVGKDLMSLGEPAEALKTFREAQARSKDPVSKTAGYNWRYIVEAELALGDIEGARQESERFVRAADHAPAEFRQSALLAATEILFAEQNYGAALEALKKARSAGVDELELLNQVLSLVLISMRSMDYDGAMRLARRMESDFPGMPVSVPAFAHNAIMVRRRMAGDIEGVLREETVELEEARAAHSLRAEIEALRQIAATYRASNSISNEIAALEEALDLERTLLTPADAGALSSYFRILNSLGDAYALARDIGRARKAYGEVIKKFQALPDAISQSRAASLYGEALLGSARVAELDDDADTAREILKKALIGLPKPALFARQDVLWQAARLERSQSEFRAAKDYYEQAVAAIHGARNSSYEVACRIEYAHFLATNAARIPDALSLAAEQIETARKLAEALGMAESQWRALYESGIVAEARGDRAGAEQAYESAIAKLESLRGALTQQEQRQALIDSEAVQDLYRRTVALLAGADESRAWEMVERGKARSFLDAVQGKRFHSAVGANPVLDRIAALEKRIADVRSELLPDNEALLRGAGLEPALAKAELQRLETEFALARQEAGLATSRDGQHIAAKPEPLSRIRNLLPPRTAIVEYGAVNDGLVVFVVSRDLVKQARCNIKPDLLRKNIQRLRALLADSHSGEELDPLLRDFSEAVWKPVAAVLPADADHLLIVPAGQLNYIPFQVLEAGDGQPLIQRYTISYLPSASVLEFLPRKHRRYDDLFLGALGNVSVEGWAPLPGTLRETAEIAKLYPKADRVAAEAFTHDQARDALLRHDIVHFATHGLVDDQAPLFSALLTAKAANQPSRLSLYELPDLNIRARLVILSACETGLGHLSGGDEISGLTRTFLQAGANTVVSSLWKVSDDSTALLMQGFHRRLRQGEAPARAMRESALEVRKQYPHPFYWAPFIVTGAF